MKSRKGIELSINVLIVLAIAMIVLAGLVVMFMGSAGPGGETMKCQTKWNAACANYIGAGGCGNEEVQASDYFDKNILECMGFGEENVQGAAEQCCHEESTTTST